MIQIGPEQLEYNIQIVFLSLFWLNFLVDKQRMKR